MTAGLLRLAQTDTDNGLVIYDSDEFPYQIKANGTTGELEIYSGSTKVLTLTKAGALTIEAGGLTLTGSLAVTGNPTVTGNTDLNGNFQAQGSAGNLLETTKADDEIGFFGVTPATQPSGWTVTNFTADKEFAGDSTTAADAVKAVASLVNDLVTLGLITGTVTAP